jgi:hypothetical protein
MAITIRNKTTEELIRRISSRTGEGPSALIHRLALAELAGGNDFVPEQEAKRRLRWLEELGKQYPPPEPKPSWEDVERETDALYDYLEEKAPVSTGKRKRA